MANPEFPTVSPGDAGHAPVQPGKVYAGNLVNQHFPRNLAAKAPAQPSALAIPTVRPTPVTGPSAELALSFQGINHYQQRTAFGGNQFSLEPPDQGLCAGKRPP